MEIKGGTWRMLFLLLLGQLVSFSLAICNFITSVISNHGNEVLIFLTGLIHRTATSYKMIKNL
jgi:hypothetical protein